MTSRQQRLPVELAGQRLVVKIGSSSLTDARGGLSRHKLADFASHVAALRAREAQVVIVSSGAVASALDVLQFESRPKDLASAQAAAAVGQGLLMRHYSQVFSQYNTAVAQVLLTAEDLMRRWSYHNVRAVIERLLSLDVVPIINENDSLATADMTFGDNDRLAALASHLVRADTLVLLTDVDGLYTAHPSQPGSQLIGVVEYDDQLPGIEMTAAGSSLGRGGMESKVQAARVATHSNIPVVLTSADQLPRVFTDAGAGTYFVPSGKRISARQLWLGYASDVKGSLHLDDGAVDAVRRRKSLLPAGISSVSGEFASGETVSLLDARGGLVGRGLVAYSSAELPGLLGKNTKDLSAERGPAFARVVVHADDLVLTTL